jgi:predicted aminopeptidase
MLVTLPGCYYAHLAEGQLRLLRAEQPIEQVLRDADLDPMLRESLALVPDVLRFAESIGLRVGGQYRDYAAWPGDRVVTALVATEPRRIEPWLFWFPLIGDAPYKGFFDLERAERAAAALRDRGLATCLVPVPAYSTLGWLDDPVTEPMLRAGIGRFVETLLHELVHATVFVAGEADWNESVANFIGQEAVVRFFEARGDADAAARERARVSDERAVAAEVARLREQVTALYEAPADAEPEASRAQLEARARSAIAALPLATRDAAALAEALRLSDPCLALEGTYERDIPLWAERLRALDGDLPRFVAAVRAAAESDDPRAALAADAAAAP